MRCFICGNQISVEITDGKIQPTTCGQCGTKYAYGKKQSIVDGKLCGTGGQMAYDYTNRDTSIATRK